MTYNTDTKTKQENWAKFAKLIENQFKFGGRNMRSRDSQIRKRQTGCVRFVRARPVSIGSWDHC